MQRTVWIRFATFLVWLLAAGCVVYWALKFVRGPQAPLSAAVAAPASGAGTFDAQALAKGLGGGQAPATNNLTPVAPEPSPLQATRFVLTGVAVQKSSTSQGVALIAVDGKPSRPYRVGTSLADGVVLKEVSAGKAMLSTAPDATTSLTLELPQLTTALAGTAIAIRPVLPTQPTTAITAVPVQPPLAAAATPSANAMAAPGAAANRPPRSLANRQREAAKESAQ